MRLDQIRRTKTDVQTAWLAESQHPTSQTEKLRFRGESHTGTKPAGLAVPYLPHLQGSAATGLHIPVATSQVSFSPKYF